MEFIISAILNMFQSLPNYCLGSYILIIPSIILLLLVDTIGSFDIFHWGDFDELMGMILLAPIGIIFVWFMLVAMILIVPIVFICFIFNELLDYLSEIYKKIRLRLIKYKEDFGC